MWIAHPLRNDKQEIHHEKSISFTILIALLLSAAGCASRETWDYVDMGVFTRGGMSAVPAHYAAFMEEDNGVTVVIQDFERMEPHEIYENLLGNEELRKAIKGAEVITFDFAFDWFDRAGSFYLSGFCKGDDNQDCLRESVQGAIDDWTGIVEEISAIRAGTPVLLRIIVVGDWFYDWEFIDPMTPEEKSTLIAFYREVNDFIEQDAARRGIVVVRAFPEPYFYEQYPPVEYLTPGAVHFSEQGSRVIADELRKAGYEFVLLK
jgi:hypothetical protein